MRASVATSALAHPHQPAPDHPGIDPGDDQTTDGAPPTEHDTPGEETTPPARTRARRGAPSEGADQ